MCVCVYCVSLCACRCEHAYIVCIHIYNAQRCIGGVGGRRVEGTKNGGGGDRGQTD